jgi:hypothetical protein
LKSFKGKEKSGARIEHRAACEGAAVSGRDRVIGAMRRRIDAPLLRYNHHAKNCNTMQQLQCKKK